MTVHELADVDVAAISLVKRGANRKRFFLRKSAEGEQLLELPGSGRLVKAGDWSSVYCVVAEPGALEDAGMLGDQDVPDRWAGEDEIRKAAHRFMKNGALVTALHESLEPYGDLVENAIALADFDVGGETIRKGSWYVAIEPNDFGRSAIESGEWTGVSIEGTGTRIPVEKAAAWDESKHPRDQIGRFGAKGGAGARGSGTKGARGKRREGPDAARKRKYNPPGWNGVSPATSTLERWNALGDEERLRRMKRFLAEGGKLPPGRMFLEDGSIVSRAKNPGFFKSEGPTDHAALDELLVGEDGKLLKGRLERVPGKQNWVDEVGGLPDLIDRAAQHLHFERGRSISVAIATAVNWAKKMCATGRAFGGKVEVSAAAQARACKAVAEWEAKKAAAKVAKAHVAKGERAEETPEGVSAYLRTVEGRVQKSLLKKIAERVGISEEEIATEFEKAAPTFAARIAQRDLDKELPDAMNVLRDVVWSAFYPPPNEERLIDPTELIEQSLDEFKEWALDLLDRVPDDLVKRAEEIGDPVVKRMVATDERHKLAGKGKALPDGSFPIASIEDLKNAIQAFGRAKDKDAAKRHIIARAKALNAVELLPESWSVKKSEGSTDEPGTPESEDQGMAWTDEEKQRIESLEKSLEELPEQIAKAVKDAGEGDKPPTPEDLKKAVDELKSDLAPKLDALEKGLEALGEGGSSQGGESADPAKPTPEQVKKAFEKVGIDPELAGIL